MKKILLLLCFIFLISIVFAENSKVHIISFKYEDGKLIFDDKLIKYGYSPDRRLIIGNYKCEIVSVDDKVLYSFNFDIPLKGFVDISNITTGELSGGIVRLDKTRFALVLPYFEKAKEMNIYDSNNIKLLKVDVEEKEKFNYYLFIVLFAVILLIVLKLVLRKKK